MSAYRWLSLAGVLGSLGTLAALYLESITLAVLSSLGVAALAAARLALTEAAWHRGRSSAFRDMAEELERAAREGAPPSDAARMMRETAARQLRRDT